MADMPLGHQVLVPSAELLTVGCTGSRTVSSDVSELRGEGRPDFPANRLTQRGFLDKAPPNGEQVGVAGLVLARDGNRTGHRG